VNEQHIEKIAAELNLSQRYTKAVVTLLDEGATIPFIARYRKEATGSLNEVAITAVRDRLEQLSQLDNRKEAILHSLEESGLLTDTLRDQINRSRTMAVLEDLYMPFRPKRRTRATIARERGLEPLAQRLFSQDGIDPVNLDPLGEASFFIDIEKGVLSSEEALAGARDIIAEWISEDAPARGAIRDFLLQKARFSSKVISGKEEEGTKYRDY